MGLSLEENFNFFTKKETLHLPFFGLFLCGLKNHLSLCVPLHVLTIHLFQFFPHDIYRTQMTCKSVDLCGKSL
jgi:hypothetical protein